MKNDKKIIKKALLWYNIKANLGEGPLWVTHSKELLWVDIKGGHVYAINAITRVNNVIYKGNKPSCIVQVSNHEFLIADGHKIVLLNLITKNYNEFASLKFNNLNIRFNDGKADPNSNLWIGTMDKNALHNQGSLYLINHKKKISEKLNNITISNGMTWSLDAKTMYYIDTFEAKVYAFDFNEKSEILNQRVIIDVPKELGMPDGMTIDNNGNLWIAMWGGFSVICWNPSSGKIIDKIEVEVPNVTCCVFGGENMDTLFITTARDGLSSAELEKYPTSGSVFYTKMNVSGFNSNYFKI